jgi:hypothetical protein
MPRSADRLPKLDSKRYTVLWALHRLGDPDAAPHEVLEAASDRPPGAAALTNANDVYRARNALKSELFKGLSWPEIFSLFDQAEDRSTADVVELSSQITQKLSTKAARELGQLLGLEPFAGSLVELDYRPGCAILTADDVYTVFDPPGFPRFGAAKASIVQDQIRRRIAPELLTDMGRYMQTRRVNYNNLRTYLRRIESFPDDTHERVRFEFGATDWWSIQGFNNRLFDDRELRSIAKAQGWIERAVPVSSAPDGSVPSFVCAHIMIVGPDYVVLTQRPQSTAYYPAYWSLSIEENMQGPHTKGGHWIAGDASIHACAKRGLAEELGVVADDVGLLGLFVEAPFASVVGVFLARLDLSWPKLRARIPKRLSDRELVAVAAEPLDETSLSRLLWTEHYSPPTDRAKTVVLKGQPHANAQHPTNAGRLLAYILGLPERERLTFLRNARGAT